MVIFIFVSTLGKQKIFFVLNLILLKSISCSLHAIIKKMSVIFLPPFVESKKRKKLLNYSCHISKWNLISTFFFIS